MSSRYRIQRRLGQGGMAEVFEAALTGELGFERKVAIKRMLPSAAEDASVAQRFLDEARIASQLHHATIVSVLDLGLLDGVPFQVLELVDGLDAERLVLRAGGTLPLEVALVIGAEIAHALDHAHHATDASGAALGLVHRDVKPSNILVSWGGDVKLTDFGIAVARDRAARTEAGGTTGTRGFMAPEQRLRTELDGRTDVFALGLALHVMATGENPLDDPAAEVALLEGSPLTLSSLLPDDVRDVISRAVAPHRLERSTAARLADEIDALLVARRVRDRRRELRAFLERLAPRAVGGGALDQLLGLDVVPASSPDDGIARYTIAAKPPSVPRVRRWPVGLAAALAGAAVLVVAVWPRDESSAVVPVVTGGTEVVPTMSSRVVAASSPAPEPPPERERPRRPAPPSVAPPPAPEAPRGTGYIQIAGEAVMGMQVLVDGTPRGYAPHKLAVPLGRHRIELVGKDGTRTGPIELEVTSFHTLGSPARPRL